MNHRQKKLLEAGWTISGFNAFRTEFKRFIKLTNLLLEDINVLYPDGTNDTAMRAYIRAVFASIEGHTFALKQLALRQSEHDRGDFSDAELAMLREEAFDLNEVGQAYSQPKFLQLPKNVRFSFEVCSRPFGFRYQIDVSSQGWNTFRQAIKVRNRLTHPKSIEDLHISDSDILCVAETAHWYLNHQKELIKGIDKYLDKLLKLIE
jgi:hypothetical protein